MAFEHQLLDTSNNSIIVAEIRAAADCRLNSESTDCTTDPDDGDVDTIWLWTRQYHPPDHGAQQFLLLVRLQLTIPPQLRKPGTDFTKLLRQMWIQAQQIGLL